MVSSRKRALRDVEPEVDTPEAPKEASLVQRIRDTWQFANLFQWIFLFGKVVKIDEGIDIDDLETECLKPRSAVLIDIGLALLKFVSSHRGLTTELFDEYTRRQYVAKAPDRNPFGTDPEPNKFHDFDVFTKLRVLHQLTIWVMLHPERIREKMDEQKPSDQTEWRIEPCGWDSDDRTYYILDDNRVYRMTEPTAESAAWKPKKNTQKAKAAARAAKRRRVSRSAARDNESEDDETAADADASATSQDNGIGGAKWECLAATLADVQNLINTFRKTRDENEKMLRDTIEEHLLPLFEKQEASRQRKALQREKELLSLEKMAFAKRSSRIANRDDQRRAEEQARDEEQKRRTEEVATRKEEARLRKLEKERDNRMMSREQRLRERAVRRQQHEDELAQLSEDSKPTGDNNENGRLSERRRQAEIEKNRQALKELEDEEDDWIFDCVCGVYGQVDDGSHSVACERCNVWQHSSCLGISEEEADRDDFHFICKPCRQPKTPIIKLKTKPAQIATATAAPPAAPPTTELRVEIKSNVKLPGKPDLSPKNAGADGTPQLAAHEIGQPQTTTGPTGSQTIPVKPAGQSNLPPQSPLALGEGNPFSSPHPNLLPPDQSPNKSRAYSTMFSAPTPAAEDAAGHAQEKVPSTSPKLNGRAEGPSSISLPPLATPTAATGAASPSKKSLATPNHSFTSSVHTPVGERSSPLLATPQLKHNGAETGLDSTPQLPPTQNGISPLKRSSPPAHGSSPGKTNSTPAPSIFPPVAALSPSPTQQNLTPPVKPKDPARPPSQQSPGPASSVQN